MNRRPKLLPNRVIFRASNRQVQVIEEIARRNHLDQSEVIRLLIDRGFKAAREDAVARSSRS